MPSCREAVERHRAALSFGDHLRQTAETHVVQQVASLIGLVAMLLLAATLWLRWRSRAIFTNELQTNR